MSEQTSTGARAISLILGWKAVVAGAVVAVIGFLIIIVPAAIIAMVTPAVTYQAGTGTHDGGALANVPAEYVADVQRAGNICPEVTPALIAAQIEAESAWNPTAVSPVGAQGISQFMPATWKAVGKDGDGDGHTDATNPRDAIFTQGHYMCDQVKNVASYKSSGAITGNILELALAAYNAGIGNVLAYGGIPNFGETRAYITRIMERTSAFNSASSTAPIVATGTLKEAITWATGVANHPHSFYEWGGEGPLGYDCSGLTQEFAARMGIQLPHKADLQARMGVQVSESQAKVGDLIFWSNDGGGYYYHVAIYIGNGRMISADSPQQGINVEPIWGRGEHIIFRRYF